MRINSNYQAHVGEKDVEICIQLFVLCNYYDQCSRFSINPEVSALEFIKKLSRKCIGRTVVLHSNELL